MNDGAGAFYVDNVYAPAPTADLVVNYLKTWVYPDDYYLTPGADIQRGKTVFMYSQISDAETPSNQLTVSISYRLQGGGWTTASATYSPGGGYWYVDWVVPGGAAAGLYDVKVEVSDPNGGSASSTQTGRFNIV